MANVKILLTGEGVELVKNKNDEVVVKGNFDTMYLIISEHEQHIYEINEQNNMKFVFYGESLHVRDVSKNDGVMVIGDIVYFNAYLLDDKNPENILFEMSFALLW